MIMKKAGPVKKGAASLRELQPEFRFDYRKAKPNRYAGHPKDSAPKSRRPRTAP